MNTRMRRAVVATAAVAVGMGGLSAASAATTDQPIRQSDFIAGLSDTRSNGTVEFLKEGLHVQTTANTATSGPSNNKAAEYWEVGMPLADAGEPSFVWYGTDTRPGMQLVVDFDGDGTGDGILVGEPRFYSNRWWANNQANTFINNNPNDAAPGANDGYAHSGPLDDWRTAYPDAEVLAAGFSLGSGVVGDGVLRSLTVGDNRYVFTDETAPLPPADVTGSATKTVNGRNVSVTMTANLTPDGSSEGEPALFEVKQGPIGGELTTRYSATMGAGATGQWNMSFPAGTAKKRIQVFVNGERVLGFQAP